MLEFELNGITYKAGTIPAMAQFHIARRLSTVIAALVTHRDPETGQVDPAKIAGPLAEAITKMSDDDTEYVLGNCLSVVQRKRANDTGYVNIWNVAAKAPQFDDIDMITMIQIVSEVVKGQIGPFGHAPAFASNR